MTYKLPKPRAKMPGFGHIYFAEEVQAAYAAGLASRVPMTDKEIAMAWISIPDPIALGSKFNGSDAIRDFVRAIEAHHKIGA